MARIDDYKESFRIAAEELKRADLHRQAELAGVDIFNQPGGDLELRVPFLGTGFVVKVRDNVEVLRDGEDGEVPLPEKILICHYLLGATGDQLTGNAITFRQIPDGHFYFDAFQRRARDPFLSTFGRNADLFRACAEMIGGSPAAMGDVAMAFKPFPRISILLVLWQGDEEFPPEASILFDSNIRSYLPVEDIAVLSGMLVYRLMGIARAMQSKSQIK